MANLTDWITPLNTLITGLLASPLLLKAIEAYQSRGKDKSAASEKARQLTLDERKQDNDEEKSFIATLKEERAYFKEEARQERDRCVVEKQRITEHYESQGATMKQVHAAEMELSREEIRRLIAENAALKAEVGHRKRARDTGQ